MRKRMLDETNLFQHLSRIFGISNPHRVRTENGWERDEKALKSDWEQVGKYLQEKQKRYDER